MVQPHVLKPLNHSKGQSFPQSYGAKIWLDHLFPFIFPLKGSLAYWKKKIHDTFDCGFAKIGKVCLSWIGTRPSLIVGKAELMKLILSDKNGHFHKPPQNPLTDLFTLGLTTLDGKKWAKRRRLIAPAFLHEKLQVILHYAIFRY